MPCSIVNVDKLIPRIMTRSPFLDPRKGYDCQFKIATGTDRMGDGLFSNQPLKRRFRGIAEKAVQRRNHPRNACRSRRHPSD
jgi:hypothetical protein